MLSVILPVLVTGHRTTTQAAGKPRAPAPCATCAPLFARPLPRSLHASDHLVVACRCSQALGSCLLRYCSNNCSNYRVCYCISTLASPWVARMNIYIYIRQSHLDWHRHLLPLWCDDNSGLYQWSPTRHLRFADHICNDTVVNPQALLLKCSGTTP